MLAQTLGWCTFGLHSGGLNFTRWWCGPWRFGNHGGSHRWMGLFHGPNIHDGWFRGTPRTLETSDLMMFAKPIHKMLAGVYLDPEFFAPCQINVLEDTTNGWPGKCRGLVVPWPRDHHWIIGFRFLPVLLQLQKAMPGSTELTWAHRSSKCSSHSQSFKMPLMLLVTTSVWPCFTGAPLDTYLCHPLHLRKSRVWTAQIVVGIAGQTLAVSPGKTRSTTAAGRDSERTLLILPVAAVEAQNNALNLQSQNILNIDFLYGWQ